MHQTLFFAGSAELIDSAEHYIKAQCPDALCDRPSPQELVASFQSEEEALLVGFVWESSLSVKIAASSQT